MKKSDLFKSAEWDMESLKEIWAVIRKIAVEEFKLDFYEPAFEVVTFEEMLNIYTSGFPIMYDHWTFGKSFESMLQNYKKGRLSIAYEVIFNTNPALCYLLENNSAVLQALTMAHAAIGHSAFFKNNFLIKSMSNANTIVPYMKKFRNFVQECEVNYGPKLVEQTLDMCHSLSDYSFDRTLIIEKTRKQREEQRMARLKAKEVELDLKVVNVSPKKEASFADMLMEIYKETPSRLHEDNILKFCAKNSAHLKGWQREIINKYCHLSQYFYPNRLTKLMNEGFASFWHYQIMNRLFDLGYLNEGHMLEFIHNHTNVTSQLDYDSKHYRGINVYKLGYSVFTDIKRMCENPTEEDKHWFPDLVGTDWVDAVNFAAYNFKDDSFLLQYLSPKVTRDLKMFGIQDAYASNHIVITDIHNDEGFKNIRKLIASCYNFNNNIPEFYVEGFDNKKNRVLFLCLVCTEEDKPDAESLYKLILKFKETMWPYPIVLKVIQKENGKIVKTEKYER